MRVRIRVPLVREQFIALLVHIVQYIPNFRPCDITNEHELRESIKVYSYIFAHMHTMYTQRWTLSLANHAYILSEWNTAMECEIMNCLLYIILHRFHNKYWQNYVSERLRVRRPPARSLLCPMYICVSMPLFAVVIN